MATPEPGRPSGGSGADAKAKENKRDADIVDMEIQDGEKKAEEKQKASERRKRSTRSAGLLFLIDEGLPKTQRWMFYLLFLHFHEDLSPPLYVYCLVPVFFVWYFPNIRPIIIHALLLGVDQFMRSKHSSSGDMYKETCFTFVFYSIPLSFLRSIVSLQGVTEEVLEPIFGPAETWPRALIPILPGFFLQYAHERDSVNGFVPESKQGILMAVFVRACAAVLPRWAQWSLWISYSAPDHKQPTMVIEWVLCGIAWRTLGISPQGAYAIYLLTNQWPQPKSWFRNYGGGPSVILEREQRGTIWFIATSVVMQIFENGIEEKLIESSALHLPPRVWLPLLLVLTIGLYLLRYGLAIRIAKYRHKPLETRQTIRLLRLRAQPCLPGSPVQCDMIHSTIRYPPPYIAISHRWGQPGDCQEIILIDGAPFLIPPSLHTLLQAKRSNYRHVIVWIDSICINQGDAEEKSRQVGMMQRIFEEALFTIGWLGEDPGAEKAFSLVERVSGITAYSAFDDLRRDESAGWPELQKMLSNDWFERVWIIQEIAVAKKSYLRYGSREIEWAVFARALLILMLFNIEPKRAEEFTLSRGLLNAVIMENIRLQVEDVDYLKLKDTLKLGLMFKATLPIDKIYALLGIIEERRTPLFHPKFARAESFSRVTGLKHPAIDTLVTLEALNDILGTATGKRQTRTGRAMLSTVDKGARHTVALVRDLERITERLNRINEGKPEFEGDEIKPDYSEKTTPELVYTHVARDLVRTDDVASFIRYAGIGMPRNNELGGLPSWVPDWSTDMSTFLFPYVRPPRPKQPKPSKGVEGTEAEKSETAVEPNFRDGGPKILHIRATVVGEITHLATLSEPCAPNKSLDIRERAYQDFIRFTTNHKAAFDLAFAHTRPRYGDGNGVEDAFYRTIIADASEDGSRPASTHAVKRSALWIRGSWPECPVAVALRLTENQPDWTDDFRLRVCESYLHYRRMQSSANAKFAHMVRTDVAPSFSKYRWKLCKKQPKAASDSKGSTADKQEKKKEADGTKERPLFIFDAKNVGPLSGLTQYVDYTIGRKLAILKNEGLMGLVPGGTEVGDLVVRVESEELCFILRQQDFTSAASNDEMFRFVGESYVLFPEVKGVRGDDGEDRWFKVW